MIGKGDAMSTQESVSFLEQHLIILIVAGGAILGVLLKSVERYGTYAWYFIVVILIGLLAILSNNVLYFFAFCLGAITALGEIIVGFHDEPLKALRTNQALYYVLLNGMISAFSLYCLILFGVPTKEELDKMKIVLAAGLGSMIIMRSKLFNIKVGSEDVSFGPEQLIKVFFRFMQDEIDRIRAQARIEFVKLIMDNIDFERVYQYTVTMLESKLTMSDEARNKLMEKMNKIRDESPQDKQLKSYRLGFLLLKEAGEDFVHKLYVPPQSEWRLRAPLPVQSISLFAKLPFFGSKDDYTNYFAYGSNLSTQQLRERLGWLDASDAKKFWDMAKPRRAKLKGYRLGFNAPREAGDTGQGFANIIPDESGVVEGVVYQMSKEALIFLDHYEKDYRRVAIKGIDVEGESKPIEGETYIASASREGLRPAKSYIDVILAGAVEHGLSNEYIQNFLTQGSKDELYRISEILDKIDKRSDPKAIELATNPPVRNSKIDDRIRQIDPGNQRLSNGPAAKKALKMMAVLSQRSDEILNAWEAALKAIEREKYDE